MNSLDIIKELKTHANPKNVAGMARFGIQGKTMLGVNVPTIRKMAKVIKKANPDTHQLAQELWDSEIHEAKLLASMIDDPAKVTAKQMDNWIKDFDSWDVCDQTCMNLFDKTEFAFDKCFEWTKRTKEFEKRAGFALMATFAWHRKDIDDQKIEKFFPIIIREACDERNYVRKAVNWALRQAGKRSEYLRKKAINAAQEILKIDNKTAQWIAKDALRELKNRG